jgi:predicted RNA binding protein YcfA (HicA-like mRNA interferase family)
MGNFRPLPIKCWLIFLELHGFKLARVRGSHHVYTKRNSRTIPVWGNEKEIPAQHLVTSCKTIGCTMAQLMEWAEENC